MFGSSVLLYLGTVYTPYDSGFGGLISSAGGPTPREQEKIIPQNPGVQIVNGLYTLYFCISFQKKFSECRLTFENTKQNQQKNFFW